MNEKNNTNYSKVVKPLPKWARNTLIFLTYPVTMPISFVTGGIKKCKETNKNLQKLKKETDNL